eukprot:gene2785-3460_t
MDAIRAQLDEFLGKDRDLLPKDRVKTENHFTDPDICKYYLCGLCPNELFTNANIRDLGPCSKLHDENCVRQYNNYKDKDQYDYEREWVRVMEILISDNDKKIKRNKERVTQNPNQTGPIEDEPENKEFLGKITELDTKIENYLKQAEELGEEGQITEAQNLMDEVEKLKTEKAELQRINEENAEDKKKMSVCDICGALLFIGDKEKRSISHLEGKKHIGFQKIRSVMEEYYKSGRKYSNGGVIGSGIGSGSIGDYRDNRVGGGDRDRGSYHQQHDRFDNRGGNRDYFDNNRSSSSHHHPYDRRGGSGRGDYDRRGGGDYYGDRDRGRNGGGGGGGYRDGGRREREGGNYYNNDRVRERDDDDRRKRYRD